MRKVMAKTGFSGALPDFFRHIQTDPTFYYPNTAEGKAAYLDAMRGRIAAVEARLGEVMTRVPRGRVVVKPVEPWLEKSAGTAGYFAGALDGSRPGILYVNTVEMRNLPRYRVLCGHLQHLSREAAIDWLDRNTANGHADNVTAIQRYIVTPGQATAYEIGKLKMMALRRQAEKTLGARYDQRRFNDALLGNGPLPLALLDRTMTAWIADGGKPGTDPDAGTPEGCVGQGGHCAESYVPGVMCCFK